jgi:hypothetical protein
VYFFKNKQQEGGATRSNKQYDCLLTIKNMVAAGSSIQPGNSLFNNDHA